MIWNASWETFEVADNDALTDQKKKQKRRGKEEEVDGLVLAGAMIALAQARFAGLDLFSVRPWCLPYYCLWIAFYRVICTTPIVTIV